MKNDPVKPYWFFTGFFGMGPALMAFVVSVLVIVGLAFSSLLFGTTALYRSHEFLNVTFRFAVVMLSAVLSVGATAFFFLSRGGIHAREYPYALGMTVGIGSAALFTDLILAGGPGNLLLWSVAVSSLIWAVILFRNKDYRPGDTMTPPGTMSSW